MKRKPPAPVAGKLAPTPYKVPCGRSETVMGRPCGDGHMCLACRTVDRLRSVLGEAVRELSARGVDDHDLAQWRELAKR